MTDLGNMDDLLTSVPMASGQDLVDNDGGSLWMRGCGRTRWKFLIATLVQCVAQKA